MPAARGPHGGTTLAFGGPCDVSLGGNSCDSAFTSPRNPPFALRLQARPTIAPAETPDSGMVAQVGGEIRLVPFDSVVGGIRGVDVNGDTVSTGRDLGICFGDEPVDTFLARVRPRAVDKSDKSNKSSRAGHASALQGVPDR